MFLHEHFFTYAAEDDLALATARESVPAGTLDLFCTQFTRVHSRSSLHLKCEADYAAQ
jgi:hypothetical protein